MHALASANDNLCHSISACWYHPPNVQLTYATYTNVFAVFFFSYIGIIWCNPSLCDSLFKTCFFSGVMTEGLVIFFFRRRKSVTLKYLSVYSMALKTVERTIKESSWVLSSQITIRGKVQTASWELQQQQRWRCRWNRYC